MSESKHPTEEKDGFYFEKKQAMRIVNENQLVRKYIHDIRNIQLLNDEMIDTIREMSDKNKMDIIISLNAVLKYMKQVCDI